MALPPDPKERDRLHRAIAAMPEPTRSVCWLSAHDRLDYPAIAARLGMTLAEVERHVGLAARHLLAVPDD